MEMEARERLIKDWDRRASPVLGWRDRPFGVDHNGWPSASASASASASTSTSRTNGNNNEYHELREIKQTQI